MTLPENEIFSTLYVMLYQVLNKFAPYPFIFQELARAKGPEADILCTLDVHALDELKVKGCPQTDDKYKYDYGKNEGEYGK